MKIYKVSVVSYDTNDDGDRGLYLLKEKADAKAKELVDTMNSEEGLNDQIYAAFVHEVEIIE